MTLQDEDRATMRDTHDATVKITEWLDGPNGLIPQIKDLTDRVKVLETEAAAHKQFKWKLASICAAAAFLSGPLGLKLFAIFSGLASTPAAPTIQHLLQP